MRRIVGLTSTLALAACQATATPSASPIPSAPEAMELTITADPLPPGTYTQSAFEPPITLELDEGWRAVQVLSGFFDVEREVGTPDVIAVQVARPMRIWSASTTEAIDVASAQEAADALAANDRLVVHDASESQLGGVTGAVVDVENAGSGHEHIMGLAAGELGIDRGRRLWVSFYDTHAGLLAVMIGGSVERWEDALAAAEPVLESVRIGDGSEERAAGSRIGSAWRASVRTSRWGW
jgi:hypothetical protein